MINLLDTGLRHKVRRHEGLPYNSLRRISPKYPYPAFNLSTLQLVTHEHSATVRPDSWLAQRNPRRHSFDGAASQVRDTIAEGATGADPLAAGGHSIREYQPAATLPVARTRQRGQHGHQAVRARRSAMLSWLSRGVGSGPACVPACPEQQPRPHRVPT